MPLPPRSSGGGPSTAPKGPPAALTGLPRDITAVETSVRDAANAFSFALWRRVNQVQRDQHVVISPPARLPVRPPFLPPPPPLLRRGGARPELRRQARLTRGHQRLGGREDQ